MRKTCDPLFLSQHISRRSSTKLTLLLCRLFMQEHVLPELNGLAEGWASV